ncbi:unnamed protein product [Adineta steineri]|uniref:Uncharacterized protein n=1 Tax=Adineta steineri TaxID=433720 RepID=A0A819KYR0_9BILA|nr:unnamed protein product [Adineta steineri]
MGLLNECEDQTEDAISYYEQFLALLLDIIVPNHPNLVFIYNIIGSLYWQRGELYKALRHYQRAFDIDAHISQTDHHETDSNDQSLEDVYNNQYKYTVAWEDYQRELQIDRNLHWKNHRAWIKPDSSKDEWTDSKSLNPDITESENIIIIPTAKHCLYHHCNPTVTYFKKATEFNSVGQYANAIYNAEKAFNTACKAYPPNDTANISALKAYLDTLALKY